MADYEVQQRTAPASASASRRRSRVDLIVLHSDLGSAFEALTAFTARGSNSAPHFYVAADGTITQLVPYKRAARHSGRASWKNRIRNIDTISVGVMLEHQLHGASGAVELQALHWLLDRLLIYYNLEEDAIMRWQPPVGDKQLGKLIQYMPAQPLARPPVVVSRSMVLGDEDDPQAIQRLWLHLQDHTYKQRGGGYEDRLGVSPACRQIRSWRANGPQPLGAVTDRRLVWLPAVRARHALQQGARLFRGAKPQHAARRQSAARADRG